MTNRSLAFTLELYNVKDTESDLVADGVTAAAQKHSGEQTQYEKTQEEQKVAKSYHILIADDVPVNLSVLKALLKKIGLNDVETAVDGQDALEKLQTSERPFDFVLTDVWIPHMDGRELVGRIRADERFAGLPVYAVTADIEEQKTFAERGFTGVLLKPLTIDTLSVLFKNG